MRNPIVVLVLILAHAGAGRANAQAAGGQDTVRHGAHWGLYNGIGFGGLGFGLGVLPYAALNPVWNEDNEVPAFAALAATTVGGIIAGAIIGSRASKTIARGGRLGGAHRVAVVAGTVSAGVTVGALAAALLINGEGAGTFLGSDERTFAALTIAGGALGSLVVWRHRGELASRSARLEPAIFRDKRYGLRLSIGF